jgi:two-component system nitrogen regulation response regulator NtrX
MSSAQILVVDDEPDIREAVKDILEDEGYAVTLAGNAAEAREARRARRPDLVLLDIWMPDLDGISLLREWGEHGGLPCPVVMMSGHGTIETAVEATRLGAYDFVEKPIALAKLLLTLRRALEHGRLSAENEGLRRELSQGAVIEPIGSSRAMQALKAQLERAAVADAPVLIHGEPGTGKEALARWLHARGARRGGPFVRVAASTLPRANAGAALFGSEDARGVTYGLLDAAQGGVLFLDGIEALEGAAQRDLAAALEARHFTRAGAAMPAAIDLRVVAASSTDLAAAARAGSFDAALLYQLDVLPLHVPPLRERADDVPELAEAFIQQFAARDNLPRRGLSAAARNRLRMHAWPGNLRELRNLVQRLLILGASGDVELAEVDAVLGAPPGAATAARPIPAAAAEAFAIDFGLPLREARDAFERAYLTRLLKQAQGSVGKLAIMAGMERTHLYRKLRDLSIDIRIAGRDGGSQGN